MSEKIADKFWFVNEGKLQNIPSRLRPNMDITHVATVPKGYKDAGMVAFHNENDGKDYLIFVNAKMVLLRYDIKESVFETIYSDEGKVKWRKYEEKESR